MMDIKEQLNVLKWLLGQIKRAKQTKEELEERLMRIYEERESPIGGVGYNPLPRNGGTGNGAASILFKLADVEERIYSQKEEIEKSIVRVMDILDYMPIGSVERRICELRFIDGKPWGDIAKRIPMSRSQCNRVCNDALIKVIESNERIQKLISESEEAYLDYTLKGRLKK